MIVRIPMKFGQSIPAIVERIRVCGPVGSNRLWETHNFNLPGQGYNLLKANGRLNETMILQVPSEIKIAFIGSKQSGKSSLVNSILKGNYSTTANASSSVGINSFRVACYDGDSTSNSTDPSVVPGKFPPSITNDFIVLPDHMTIHVMTMDVPLQDDLFNVNLDVNLVLTDVPGINTQDAHDVYMQYVNAQWKSFDCVVVVLSAQEDVLLQLDILHLVKENLISNRKIPIMFVCNKVDDTTNQSVMKSFEQLRKLVQSIFMIPIIPFCAENAFFYRSAMRWTLKSLQELSEQNRPLLDKIIAKVFPNLKNNYHYLGKSDLDKFKFIITYVNNSEVYCSGNLASSNFPCLQLALGDCILCCKEPNFPDEELSAASFH